MEDYKARAVKVYRDIFQLPFIEGARISGCDSLQQIEIKWKQKDIDRGKTIGFAKSYLVSKGDDGLNLKCELSFQRDTTSILKETYSSDGRIRAVLLKDKSSKDEQYTESHQYIEVWQSDKLVKSLSVKTDLKKYHGKIHVDNDQFSSFQLCSDGSKLLYVAEKKRPECVSYFKKSSGEDNDKPKPVEEVEGAENVFQESWGEQLTDTIQPIVAVLNIATEECVILEAQDRDLSLGKAQWRPKSNTELIFVGYNNNPQKLGYIYCVNKESYLYWADTTDSKCTPIDWGHGKIDISSPRFNPQGTKLVFVEFDATLPSPHWSCAVLKMLDCNTKEVTTVIDQVSRPQSNGFTGVYNISFPERCWDSSGERVYFSDIQKASVQIVCVNVVTREAGYITSSLTRQGTYTLFDVCDDLMVFSYSCPSQPPQVFVSSVPSSGRSLSEENMCMIAEIKYDYGDQIQWKFIESPDIEGVQSFVATPTNPSTTPPLIVWPHGGPHTAFTANFITWVECLTVLGYSVLLANYRGSVGCGQDILKLLPGNVGTMDVRDVQTFAELIVNSGSVNKDRVVVTGGSHGGFLSAHLVGQYPDFYKAAFIRNPVINMAIMSSSTDIPDWCFCEAGLPYDPASLPSADQYSTLLEKSPISHANKVKAAIVLALGGEDRRCPPSQGKELYFTLKALGKDVSLYWYPNDCHPLMNVDTTGDCFMHLALHFYKHCLKP